ncbi:hypothetical protein [Qipengyuania flava]|uniref:hypothetical protein n=1 Tax=Qipengyuania flava TaxID=192812 RepID=UPI001C5792A5|nr:hypothetical protein [Qipengyuania flava]MBW3168429.1 hypothetical protein [Qipengyuania flava]MBY5965667.1 hypothetical protein [Qipengyuania flava]MBY6011991.1 hypothetical protein [Qipengyuania flava]MBY6026433.1 hypothetical protein [Qipengyuania flava]
MGTKLHHKLSTALVAAIALCQAQVAHAQACLAPDDVTDAGIYAIPVVADGFRASCAPHLAADGFFATQGADFVAPYSAMQNERWPGTLRVFLALAAGGGADEQADALGELPGDALRPIVDAFFAQKIGEEIKPQDCSKIERAMELLAPLPPENLGGLLTFILDVTDVKEPAICETEKQ